MKRNRQTKTQINSPLYIERAEEDQDVGVLEGYFIKYNSPARYGNEDFYEQVDPNALTETLANNKDIKCFYNHNYDLILGRMANNTLDLRSDDIGLYGTVRLNLNDSMARDVYERVKRGDITGCSFGAWIEDEDYDKDQKLITVRKVRLEEVSVCPLPFYDSTSISARAKEAMDREELKRMKEILEAKYVTKTCKD